MRLALRSAVPAASVLVASGGISGCSNEPESNTGKMDSGKMGRPMDKMEEGKIQ
jgi:hypothetical protein